MVENSKIFLNQIINENLINYNLSNEKYKGKVSLVIVSHILPDKLDFINTLNDFFDIGYILPKPKSIDKKTFKKLKNNNYKILDYTREELQENKELIINKLKSLDKNIIIVDIGGYFSKIINDVKNEIKDKLLGVIEDTENGHQKYENEKIENIPIFSVARSKLKESEDLLVGESVVFSTDNALRLNNDLLKNKNIGILGFGKIGRSIARDIHGKSINFQVYDKDSFKGVEIKSYGYKFSDKETLIKESDLIFCSTGNLSLKGEDFLKLKNNVIIASVTSSDDEMDKKFLQDNFKKKKVNKATYKYTKDGKKIYLLNDGETINFLNNAVVGKYIYLVQAEIIHCIFKLLNDNNINKNIINTVDNNEKEYIPKTRLKYFNN